MTEQELQQLRIISSLELHQSTQSAVRQERSAAMVVVHHLRENDRRRLWAEMGFESLFEYCVKTLGYSESQTYRRISALKLLREIPEVEEKIVNGELNLTTINQAQTFFNREAKSRAQKISIEEKQTILCEIENKTQKQVELEFVKISPAQEKRDREVVLSTDKIQISFAADRDLSKKFQELRELLGQKIAINANYNEFLHKVCDVAIEKLKPSKRNASPKRLSIAAIPKEPSSNFERKYIPVATKRTVWERDQSQCTFQDPFSGRRCACRTHLQLDHIIPIAKGGDNSLENLRRLCKAHNQWVAIQEFGVSKMGRYMKNPIH